MSRTETTQDLVKGTALAAVTGATVGATVGILRQKPVGSYAFSGGLNSSLFAMTFIAFRESFLRYQRSKNPTFGYKDSQTADIDQLWSSTIAGAVTGGILSALARGPKSIPSGSFMFGTMALGGQWIYSRASRYRQDQILATAPIGSISASSSSEHPKDKTIGTGLLNVLPVHRTDVDDYEHKLRNKLRATEEEIRILESEKNRRERERGSVPIENTEPVV